MMLLKTVSFILVTLTSLNWAHANNESWGVYADVADPSMIAIEKNSSGLRYVYADYNYTKGKFSDIVNGIVHVVHHRYEDGDDESDTYGAPFSTLSYPKTVEYVDLDGKMRALKRGTVYIGSDGHTYVIDKVYDGLVASYRADVVPSANTLVGIAFSPDHKKGLVVSANFFPREEDGNYIHDVNTIRAVAVKCFDRYCTNGKFSGINAGELKVPLCDLELLKEAQRDGDFSRVDRLATCDKSHKRQIFGVFSDGTFAISRGNGKNLINPLPQAYVDYHNGVTRGQMENTGYLPVNITE